MNRWFAVINIETGQILHTEKVHWPRDISNKAALAMEPGTVWAKGASEADAVHNARVKAKKTTDGK